MLPTITFGNLLLPSIYCNIYQLALAEWSTLIGPELYRTEIFSWCCYASSLMPRTARGFGTQNTPRLVLYGIRDKGIGGFHGRKSPIIGALMP